jgi:hypothetical protein
MEVGIECNDNLSMLFRIIEDGEVVSGSEADVTYVHRFYAGLAEEFNGRSGQPLVEQYSHFLVASSMT